MSNARSSIPTGAHWGTYRVEVADGRIVAAHPDPNDPDPTPLHAALPELIDHPTRIREPVVRESYLREGVASDRARRGAESFVPVSWDRALDLIARELQRVRAEHGCESIFAGSYGWASAGRLHHPRTLMKRLLGAFGGYTDHVLDYSRGAALVIVPHVVGNAELVGGALTAWESILAESKLIVSFGGMAMKNMHIDSGGMGMHRGPGWMRAIRAAGIEVVSVSPLREDIDEGVHAQWLPLRPNTDTALMLGLAHTLHVEGLHDRAFLARYTVGYERFAAYLTGEADGVAKDADWAAALTEIPAAAIRDLARRMASRRTMITLSYSLQRADHGEQPMWMGIVLAAMLGQIGLPGGGVGIGYGAMGTKGAPRANAPLRAVPTGANPTGRFIPVARIADLLLQPGAEFDFNGKRYTYPDIRLVYWGGGNPFHHHQDLNRLLAAWRRPETIVVQDSFWTAAARHADIVLPAATTLERNDISAGWYDRVVYAMAQAVAPIGAARSDFEIVRGLAERLGLEATFTEGRDEMARIRSLYDALRTDLGADGAALPSFESFWTAGRVELPGPAKPFVAFEAFRADPERNPLRTPSGRIEIFSETIAGFGYADCPGHPTWLAPCEWLGAPLAARYPLHLISNQPPGRLHGQMDPARPSRDTKIAGREPVLMNPDDAARRGIRDGDLVRIYNDRGACMAGARVSDAARPGVIRLATGAWYDPLEPGVIGSLDKHGNPNMLTIDKGTSRLAQCSSAHSALVEVERWSGAVPPVTAHVPPTITVTPRD